MAEQIDTPKTPEMVERVARAMFDVGKADAHGPDIYEEQADWWEDCARAAIAAMREPTQAMAKIGFDIEERRYAAHHPQEDRCAVDCWRAIIDAALGE